VPVCRHCYGSGRTFDTRSPKRGIAWIQNCACRWDDESEMAVWPDGRGATELGANLTRPEFV
jgi:hypothetical protein